MAVRRLHPDQPPHFAFTAENLAWARATIAKYPPGKEASAVIPLMWRAQEQAGGWLPEPAIRAVCDLLDMAYIRGLEIATFYTMFQLSPVGSKAHVQVCGTTPCMLRGARDLVAVCKRRIGEHQHVPSADGTLSWEEVECIGVCANAPVVQIGRDTFEDLTPRQLEVVLDGFVSGKPPKPGSQIGRTASCPEGGPTTLTDETLYDGSTIGAWKKRFEETSGPPIAPKKRRHPRRWHLRRTRPPSRKACRHRRPVTPRVPSRSLIPPPLRQWRTPGSSRNSRREARARRFRPANSTRSKPKCAAARSGPRMVRPLSPSF